MEKKLKALEDAIALVKDGDVIAIGNQKPLAIVREIIRQKKKDLTIYFMMGNYEVDMLCGSGCVRECHGLFVMPTAGPHFRRMVQEGSVRMIDEGEAPLHVGILAGSMDIPFIPLKGYYNDMVTIHEDFGYKRFNSPVNDEELLAVPALKPDVAILHMPRGDRYGNIQAEDVFTYDRVMGWWDKRIIMAATTAIVSVEEIIATSEIRKHADRTFIPFYDVDVVAQVERGCHPEALPGSYGPDTGHMQVYGAACQDEASYTAYLEKYIRGVKGNEDYLALIDGSDSGKGGRT